MRFKNIFRKPQPKLELEPFASKESLFRFLGDVATMIANKDISERAGELALNSVTKFFTAQELYKTLQGPAKDEAPPAKQTDLDTLKTEVQELRKRFDAALDPKITHAMFQ